MRGKNLADYSTTLIDQDDEHLNRPVRQRDRSRLATGIVTALLVGNLTHTWTGWLLIGPLVALSAFSAGLFVQAVIDVQRHRRLMRQIDQEIEARLRASAMELTP